MSVVCPVVCPWQDPNLIFFTFTFLCISRYFMPSWVLKFFFTPIFFSPKFFLQWAVDEARRDTMLPSILVCYGLAGIKAWSWGVKQRDFFLIFMNKKIVATLPSCHRRNRKHKRCVQVFASSWFWFNVFAQRSAGKKQKAFWSKSGSSSVFGLQRNDALCILSRNWEILQTQALNW